jgi:hypothetical protein
LSAGSSIRISSDSPEYDAARGAEDQGAGAGKRAVDARADRFDAARFHLQHATPAGGEIRCCGRGCEGRCHIRWRVFPIT